MVKSKSFDHYLLLTVIFLLVLGTIILFNVSVSISQHNFGEGFYYLKHQFLYGLLPGIILAFLLFKIDLNRLKKAIPLVFIINLIALVLVFFPKIGLQVGGSSRWLNLGILSVQPSEFLKLTFLLYLASWLESREKKDFKVKSKKNFSETFIAFLVFLGIIGIILVLQPDLSTFGVILVSSVLMFFLAKTPFWQTVFIIFLIFLLLVPLIKYAPYRLNRFLVFLNPDLEPMGRGYQLKQALIAVGSGGISGVGLGLSEQKYGFLPQSISDSIFAIFAEETGFLGSIVLVSLFIIFFLRGFKIGKEEKNLFLSLTAFGITSWIVLQALVNIGAMIGILPLTGIPLPFVSYGGSALISELAGVGILLNISKR